MGTGMDISEFNFIGWIISEIDLNSILEPVKVYFKALV